MAAIAVLSSQEGDSGIVLEPRKPTTLANDQKVYPGISAGIEPERRPIKQILVEGYKGSQYVYGEIGILDYGEIAGYLYGQNGVITYVYGEIARGTGLIYAYDGNGNRYVLNRLNQYIDDRIRIDSIPRIFEK
jgi:hypothetical protein